MGFEELIENLRYLDGLRENIRRSSLYHSDKDRIVESVDLAIERYELAIVGSGDYPTF